MIDSKEQLDMSRFRKMYTAVAVVPMVPIVLAVALWFISAHGWSSAPIDVTSGHLPMFAFLAFISLPLTWVLRSAILRRTGPFHAGGHGFKPGQEYWGEDAAVLRITQAAIIGMILQEQSVILGFLLVLLSHAWRYYIPFASYTALGWIVMFPRPSQVREWYAQQTASTTHISVPL
ncbi:MAG: hypothetical protein ACYDHQ_06275 [Coriobacteriia bacterium]